MNIQLEVWQSDCNRQERHYFLPTQGRGYQQQGAYLFGYNPELVPEGIAAEILLLITASISPKLLPGSPTVSGSTECSEGK